MTVSSTPSILSLALLRDQSMKMNYIQRFCEQARRDIDQRDTIIAALLERQRTPPPAPDGLALAELERRISKQIAQLADNSAARDAALLGTMAELMRRTSTLATESLIKDEGLNAQTSLVAIMEVVDQHRAATRDLLRALRDIHGIAPPSMVAVEREVGA